MANRERDNILDNTLGKKGKYRIIRDELPYDFSYVEYKEEVDKAVAE